MKYTQLPKRHAEILRPVIEALDALPNKMRSTSGLTQKEAAEVRARVDALIHVVRRHTRAGE